RLFGLGLGECVGMAGLLFLDVVDDPFADPGGHVGSTQPAGDVKLFQQNVGYLYREHRAQFSKFSHFSISLSRFKIDKLAASRILVARLSMRSRRNHTPEWCGHQPREPVTCSGRS